METVVMVCGSHGWEDPAAVHAHLDTIHANTTGPLTILTADRHGVDQHATDWATRAGATVTRFRTDWDHDGHKAAEIRNNRMLDHLLDARTGGATVALAVFRLPDDRRSAELDRIVQTAKSASVHGTLLRALVAA